MENPQNTHILSVLLGPLAFFFVRAKDSNGILRDTTRLFCEESLDIVAGFATPQKGSFVGVYLVAGSSDKVQRVSELGPRRIKGTQCSPGRLTVPYNVRLQADNRIGILAQVTEVVTELGIGVVSLWAEQFSDQELLEQGVIEECMEKGLDDHDLSQILTDRLSELKTGPAIFAANLKLAVPRSRQPEEIHQHFEQLESETGIKIKCKAIA